MTQRLSALVLLTIASLSQTNQVPHQIPLKVAEVGGNVTLQCTVSKKDGKFFSWYKQPLGHMLQKVATASVTEQKLSEQFNNIRFKFTKEDSQYYLTIKNITKDDEATYFCRSGSAYVESFPAGIYLAVSDRSKQTLTHVRQTPETTSVQEGDTVTLQCSLLPKSNESSSHCLSNYNVYWFRVGSGESHPNFIYTHTNSSDAWRSSCVYRLTRTIQNSSDAGIYYCAVVTCAEILLGQGTKVEISSQLSPVVLVLGVLLTCCVTVIVAFVVYINQTVFQHFKGADKGPSRGHRSSRNQPSDTDADANEANYVALNFATRKTKGMKKKTDLTTEVVYSAVRANHSTLH